MIIQKSINFFQNMAEAGVSEVFTNSQADVMSLQINGELGGGSIILEGRNSSQNEWVPLAGINLSNFTISKDGFTSEGLYELGITSVRQLRARAENVDLANVNVLGLLISTVEV